MRIGFVFAVSVAVVCGNAAAGAAPAGINGSWAGEMRQIETTAEVKYPMALTINGKTAQSDYPTLNCSGTWTKVAEKNGYTIYAERVTNKKGATCIDGMVMVTMDQGKVFVGWFAAYAGEPSVATAVLSKAAK
jgi:hypothetical protein